MDDLEEKTWYHLRKPLCGLILSIDENLEVVFVPSPKMKLFLSARGSEWGRILGPKSDAKAAATGTNVPPWSLWFTVFANHSKASFETEIARTPNDGRSEKRTHTHTHWEFPLFLQLKCSLSKQDWMKWTMWCYVWRRRFARAVCGCILSKLMIEFLDLLRKTVTWDPSKHTTKYIKILES